MTNTIIGDCTGSGCPSTYENGNTLYNGGLAPIGNYGGPTQTAPPLPDATSAVCGGIATKLTTDQRGLPRGANYTVGKCYDSGAVQTLYSVYFVKQPPATVGAGANFSVAVQVDESGMPFPVSGIVMRALLPSDDPGSLNITRLTTNGSGFASSNAVSVSAPGTGDELVVVLAVASDQPLNVNLVVPSNAFNVTDTNV